MKHALNALSYPVGRRKARSLMREAGVKVRYRKKFKVTTNSDRKQPVFENVLARDFTAAEPDQASVTPASQGIRASATCYFLVTGQLSVIDSRNINTCR